ncbi:MAG: saccharopine dehydrogenase NADP-binding domain-containing protein [Pseudomonadota bacterium]
MKPSAEFDVVVYGASGFTGRLVAEYLSQKYGVGGDVKWAMAGRSADKLAAVRDEIGAPADTPLVVADANDPASLKAMVERTKVVLTTVGPYQLYSGPLVAACVETGTDYVDLCGEPAWMAKMIDQHQAAAEDSGARIVFSCGFDSIPFDLGVYYLQDAARDKLGGPVPRVKGRMRKMRGEFSGGTAASFQATMAAAGEDPSVIEALRNPFALTPGFEGPEQPKGDKPEFDEALNSWAGPFVMAVINTRNIHRSNFLMGHPYGTDFVYDEMMLTGPGDEGEAFAKAAGEAGGAMLGPDAPKPGEGPDKASRDAGYYDAMFVGLAKDGRTVVASVAADEDPGYGSTSKMIAEAAITLAENTATKGGLWTPAAALGHPLVHRLQTNAGLTFKVES